MDEGTNTEILKLVLERRKEEKVEKDQKKNNDDVHVKTVIYLTTLF